MQVPIKDGAGKTQSEMSKMTEKLMYKLSDSWPIMDFSSEVSNFLNDWRATKILDP